MKAMKNMGALSFGTPTEEELREINKLAKRELAAGEVFKFDVLLCDNRVDRDLERFTTGALYTLAELFYGKTGIFDHTWSASGQKARIFKTEVVTDNTRDTAYSEPYAYLKASAYMLRTEWNAELISDIEGGIKREVSVGCGVKPGRCSICTQVHGGSKCSHIRGKEYGGKTCFVELCEPTDAYEWSFVAVPAQRDAGVLKKYRGGENGNHGGADELFKLAALGESYLKKLREEVVRLGLLEMTSFEPETLKSAVSRMEEPELLAFKAAFERAVSKRLPLSCQLSGKKRERREFDSGEFLI